MPHSNCSRVKVQHCTTRCPQWQSLRRSHLGNEFKAVVSSQSSRHVLTSSHLYRPTVRVERSPVSHDWRWRPTTINQHGHQQKQQQLWRQRRRHQLADRITEPHLPCVVDGDRRRLSSGDGATRPLTQPRVACNASSRSTSVAYINTQLSAFVQPAYITHAANLRLLLLQRDTYMYTLQYAL